MICVSPDTYTGTCPRNCLIVQSTICRKNRARSPSRVINTEESDKGSDIVDLCDSRCRGRRLDDGLHITAELLVAFIPLVYFPLSSQKIQLQMW